MNKVTLVGNVVNDLELKDYKNNEKEGKYVKFTLAVNEYNVKKNERIATFIEKKYNVDIALTDFTFIDSKKKIVDEELAF